MNRYTLHGPRFASGLTPWEEREVAILNPADYAARRKARISHDTIRTQAVSHLSTDGCELTRQPGHIKPDFNPVDYATRRNVRISNDSIRTQSISQLSSDGGELTRQPRRLSASSITTYQRMCEKEREAYLQRKKVDKFARELIDRLLKVKRRIDGHETEEERAVRELVEECKRSALYLHVVNADANASTDRLSSSNSNSSNPVRRLFRALSSQKSSRTSSGQPSNVTTPNARGSSFASTAVTTPSGSPTSIRDRRISLPLERDYQYRAFRRYSPSSIASDGAVFRMPMHPAPQRTVPDTEPISGEIFRIISDPSMPSQPSIIVYAKQAGFVRRLSNCDTPLRSRTYSRTSTKDGQELIEEVNEIDEWGKKTVKLHWGHGVDEIVPHSMDRKAHKKSKKPTGDDEQLLEKLREAGLEVREKARKMMRNVRGLGRNCDIERYSRSGCVSLVKVKPRRY